MNKRACRLLLLAVLFPFPPAPEAATATDTISMSVTPDRVQVGTFYHRAKVRVTADAPFCDASILTLESEKTQLVLVRKGRLGPVWMNVGRVTLNGAPAVYILASSENLAAVSSPAERARLGLGFEALGKMLTFEGDGPLTGHEFDEFIKLKTRDGTYAQHIPIEMRPSNGSRYTISALLPLPSVVPPGEYLLRLYCFEDGVEIAHASSGLVIEKVGLPRWESDLAHRHPAVYGIVAVLAAAAAGFATGLAFTSRGGHGH